LGEPDGQTLQRRAPRVLVLAAGTPWARSLEHSVLLTHTPGSEWESQAFSVGYDRVTLALEAVRQVERGMSFFVVIWGTGQGCRSRGRPRALHVGLPMWWWLPAPGLFWTENRIAGSEMGIGGAETLQQNGIIPCKVSEGLERRRRQGTGRSAMSCVGRARARQG
jgi:hypothetical protein